MEHNSSYYYPFNHLQHPLYFNTASPVHAPPAPGRPEPEEPKDYHHYAPASPSDFIYNSSVNFSANGTAKATASTSIFDRSSRPSSSSSSSSRSLFSISISNEAVLGCPPAGVEYSGGRPSTGAVAQSVLDYLEVPGVLASSLQEPRLPASSPLEPVLGFEEHRRQRQRQSTMNMGPGPSKSIPPALSLGGGERGSNASSSEETVVIKRGKERSSSPVPWVSIPLGQRVKRWVPRVSQGEQGKQEEQGEQMKQMEGDVGTDNGISGSKTWEERGDGVVERVVMPPPTVHSMGTNAGVGMVAGMDTGMGTGMAPTIMPKMGLFKPIRWDGPSSSSKAKARRIRAWETVEEQCGNVHLRRTFETQLRNRNRNESGNRDLNDETEDEKGSDAPISPHTRSPKRLKTSSLSGCFLHPGPGPTETNTDTEIKQEPGPSPPPSAVFAQIPMYDSFDSAPSNNSGYESSGRHDNSLSSRSISPLTRVPTPRRVLFTTTTTPNRIMTGTTRETTQPSLRAVSKQLKKRNREMALGQGQGREDNRELSREPRKKRREEGGWNLPGGSQGQHTHDTSLQQQQKNRGSSEEREEKGWTTTTISAGSSEEGEVSSHYENENSYSYSCGQPERGRDDAAAAAAAAAAASSNNALSYTDHQEEEEWCRPPFSFTSSSSSSAALVSFESSARYDDHVSSASQERSTEEEEGYRQAIIQMVQDTCLEASKRYIRAHCVNRGARDGGGSPDISPAPRQTVSTRSARKARRRRKHKLRSRQDSSSSSTLEVHSPAPSRQRRRRRRQNRTKKQTTTTTTTTTTTPPPPSACSSSYHQQPPPDIHLSDSLLPNMSQICTLLWSRSQSLRLHDTDSIELHTARNMYWLLSWAETVAFAVLLPASSTSTSTSTLTTFTVPDPRPNPNPEPDPFDSTTTISVGSSFPGFGVSSSSSSCSSSLRQRKTDRDRDWDRDREGFGEGVSEEGDKAQGEFETINGRVVREQQRIEEMMKKVFDEGGMLCEFLGYGEGVERLGRVREFYGF